MATLFMATDIDMANRFNDRQSMLNYSPFGVHISYFNHIEFTR